VNEPGAAAPENVHLEQLASGGNNRALHQFFAERIGESNTATRTEPLATVGLFDDLQRALPAPVALELIPTAVDLALEWRRGSLFDLAIAQLEAVVRASESEEMPSALDDAWDDLSDSVHRQRPAWVSRHRAILDRHRSLVSPTLRFDADRRAVPSRAGRTVEELRDERRDLVRMMQPRGVATVDDVQF